jgi:hypothetical protein
MKDVKSQPANLLYKKHERKFFRQKKDGARRKLEISGRKEGEEEGKEG